MITSSGQTTNCSICNFYLILNFLSQLQPLDQKPIVFPINQSFPTQVKSSFEAIISINYKSSFNQQP